MTVIAWDGRTLASDRRGTDQYARIFSTRKIWRIGDALVAFSGTADRIGAFRRWAEDGFDATKYPENPKDDSVFMLVVRRASDGRVELLRYEDTPWPIPIEDCLAAMGSSSEVALAVMHCGKTAAEACEIAALVDAGCGNGVDTLVLDPTDDSIDRARFKNEDRFHGFPSLPGLPPSHTNGNGDRALVSPHADS